MAKIKVVSMVSHKDEVLEALAEKVEDALDAIGATAEGHAKENCPVDTGLLRNSITYASSGNSSAISTARADSGYASVSYAGKAPKGTSNKKSVYIGTNVEYAQKQELVDMNHRVGRAHFLRDALAQHGKEYAEILKGFLEE